VIGVPLPLEKFFARSRHCPPSPPFRPLVRELSLAICTTTRAKNRAASFLMQARNSSGGFAKGRGYPSQHGTMLAFVATDAAIAPSLLQKTLQDVTQRTFNAISVDGDTSTNDTLWFSPTAKPAFFYQARTSAHRAFTAALRKFAVRSRCKSWLTAKARSASSKSKCATRKTKRRTPHRGNDRHISARQNGLRRRRPQLGPHLRRRRTLRRFLRHVARGYQDAGIPVLRRPAARFQRARRSNRLLSNTSPGCGSDAGKAMARYWTSTSPRVRPHQCSYRPRRS